MADQDMLLMDFTEFDEDVALIEEVSIFDALTGGVDFTFGQQNIGGIDFRIANMTMHTLPEDISYSSICLATFLGNYVCPPNSPSTSKLLVLDCGPGLPGVAALKRGWSDATFAAACEDTLLNSTWPNVFLNCSENMARVKCIHSWNFEILSDGIPAPFCAAR